MPGPSRVGRSRSSCLRPSKVLQAPKEFRDGLALLTSTPGVVIPSTVGGSVGFKGCPLSRGPQSSLVSLGACCHLPSTGAVRSGIVTNLHAPTWIPVEVCSAVGLPVSTQLDTCMDKVKADVAVDGVAAPSVDVAGLQKVVANAKDRGVDLKVVVMEKSPPIDTRCATSRRRWARPTRGRRCWWSVRAGPAVTAQPMTGLCLKPVRIWSN